MDNRFESILKAIRNIITNGDIFYIAGHTNPDGDSIGASFGLALAIEKMGKEARVILESYHSKYNLIPGSHLQHDGEEIWECPLFCLDCADVTRLSGHARKLADTLSTTICIDHHYTNTGYASYNFVDGTAASTCELVYTLLDGFVSIDRDIASALYAGMVCDTGGFRFNATSPKTLNIAATLIAQDIPFPQIYAELVHLHTYTEIKLLSRVLDSTKRAENGKIVYACVPKSMMMGLDGAPDATPDDLEGVVEYLLNIRRAEVSLLLYEREDGKIKISLRSKNTNIASVAMQFGGGGHQLAAGAQAVGDIYEICEQVLQVIKAEMK